MVFQAWVKTMTQTQTQVADFLLRQWMWLEILCLSLSRVDCWRTRWVELTCTSALWPLMTLSDLVWPSKFEIPFSLGFTESHEMIVWKQLHRVPFSSSESFLLVFEFVATNNSHTLQLWLQTGSHSAADFNLRVFGTWKIVAMFFWSWNYNVVVCQWCYQKQARHIFPTIFVLSNSTNLIHR